MKENKLLLMDNVNYAQNTLNQVKIGRHAFMLVAMTDRKLVRTANVKTAHRLQEHKKEVIHVGRTHVGLERS